MTGGFSGTPNPTTLVVAQAYVGATTRVDDVYRAFFPGWSSGFALDQGLAEWHPFGCFYGYLFIIINAI